MTASDITRRGFVVGASAFAASLAAAKAGLAGAMVRRPPSPRLLVALHRDAASPAAGPVAPGGGGWVNRLAALLPGEGGGPSILALCRTMPPLAEGPAPVAILCREALHLLPAPRLAALLRGPGPVRIAAAPGARPASAGGRLCPRTWHRLGALLAEPATPRLAVVDLGPADPPLEAGLAAFEAGLGGRAADMAVLVLCYGPRSSARADPPGRAVQTAVNAPQILIREVLRDRFDLADGVFGPFS